MTRFFRILKRKAHVRRTISAALLVIALFEIGSSAVNRSEDLSHFQSPGFCGMHHVSPLAVDMPTKQKNRGPSFDLLDGMMAHAATVNIITAPRLIVSTWTSEACGSVIRPLPGDLAAPFHPPQSA